MLTAAFAIGLLARSRRSAGPLARVGVSGAWLPLIEAAAGLLTLAFPEGEGGAASELGAMGVMHVALAGISSLSSVFAILLLGRWLAGSRRRAAFWRVSVLSAVVVVVSGAATAYAVANRLPLAGLAEQVTIGTFLVWLLAASVLAAHEPARATLSAAWPPA